MVSHPHSKARPPHAAVTPSNVHFDSTVCSDSTLNKSLPHLLFLFLLFTFPALLGLVPCHSDLPSLPGSQVILSQGPSHPTQHGPWLTFQEVGTLGTTAWSRSAVHPHRGRPRVEDKAGECVAIEWGLRCCGFSSVSIFSLPSLNLLGNEEQVMDSSSQLIMKG